MYPREPTSPPTQFSVHAEFTISHPGADDPRNMPRTSMERDEATGGVRMTYTWQPEWVAGETEAAAAAAARGQSEDRTSEGGAVKPSEAWPTSASNSNKSIYSDTPSAATLTPPRSVPARITSPSAMFDTDYTRGYQKGNLFFTSTPPPKTGDESTDSVPATRYIPKDPKTPREMIVGRGLIHDSSGYGSDLLSPNSQAGSLPRRVLQPYDRKCRSTCNITLSTNLTGPQAPVGTHAHCNRTQSLRCQTPSLSYNKNLLHFYGCGDPWCHHLKQSDDLAASSRISPVPEESLASTKQPSRTDTYTVKDLETGKKDACVQTFEMVDKSTSPFLRKNSTDSIDSKGIRRYQRRGLTEPIRRRNYSPAASSFTPDSLESVKPTRRLVKSPKLRRLPAFDHSNEPEKEQSPADSLKKPRTVHIDVYCTGTEMESNASSESSDEGSKTASTPQTVFENEKMRVTHRQAGERDLPFYLRKSGSQKNVESKLPLIKSFETNTSVEREESDDDNASTAYPSKRSSYSNIGDLSASISSVPRSWTTYSMSSCAIPEDYDSVANTSWKDTFSDIDSLLMSRSSIAQTESLDFVPRRMQGATQSIDETPEFSIERKNLLDTPSVASIQQSDSFEYANSEDRIRIKQMEEMWKNRGSGKSLKSPISEQTLQLQQKRMQEYMDKKIKDKKKWDSKDSDSNDSDGSGKGWTFVKDPTNFPKNALDKPNGNIKKAQTLPPPKKEPAVTPQRSPLHNLPNTIRDALLKSASPRKSPSPVRKSPEPSFVPPIIQRGSKSSTNLEPQTKARPPPLKKAIADREDQGSLSDSSPTSRSPSLRQRLSLDPNLRSPFMLLPGKYTEPRSIAKKFGAVVSVMKKPGHHVGPAKNPDCLCDHCQSYWESVGYRNRTRSMGDSPSGKYIQNWKEFLEEQQKATDSGMKRNDKLPYTDF